MKNMNIRDPTGTERHGVNGMFGFNRHSVDVDSN